METIKEIAEDMLCDQWDQAEHDDVPFTTAVEFIDYAFEEANINNTLPGYESHNKAMQVLMDDRITVGEILDERGEYVPCNPFLNPTGFLVFCVQYTAAKMVNNGEFDLETGLLARQERSSREFHESEDA